MLRRSEKRSQAGFTLAELLIVVAIVVVLAAIAIPVFASSIASAEEATCEANRRSLKGIITTDYLANFGKVKPDQASLEKSMGALGSTNENNGLCPQKGSYRLEGDADKGLIIVKCAVHGMTIEDELNEFTKTQANWSSDDNVREAYKVATGNSTWPELTATDGSKVYLQFKSYDRSASGVFLYANSNKEIKNTGQRWVAQYICDSTGLIGTPGQWYEVPKNTNVAMTDTSSGKGKDAMTALLKTYENNKVNLVNGTFVKA